MSQLSDSNRKQLYEDIRSAESLAPKIASPSLLFGSKAFAHHQAPKQEVKHRDELNPVTPLTMNYGSKLQGSTHPLETFRSLMNFSHLPVPLGLLWKSGKADWKSTGAQGHGALPFLSSGFAPQPPRAASLWKPRAASRRRSSDKTPHAARGKAAPRAAAPAAACGPHLRGATVWGKAGPQRFPSKVNAFVNAVSLLSTAAVSFRVSGFKWIV